MKKRITSILTALALSLSLFPVWSSAAGTDGGTDCGFVCNVCPTEALDEDGQGQIVIARSMELQAAPDETTAPVGALDLHDCTGGTSGSGYTWAVAGINEDNEITSGTLTLSAGFNATTVVLPDATVTIETEGECTIGELYVYGKSPQKTKLTISGTGTLTVTNRINICGGNNNALTVDTDAELIAQDGIAVGASGGVDSIVKVDGKLTVISNNDNAMYVGKVIVGNTGNLNVSGNEGVCLNGMTSGDSKRFTITGDGQFTANCSTYNLMASGSFSSETNAEDVIAITAEYMPYDCVQQINPSSTAINLYRISKLNDETITDNKKIFTGPMYIHLNHNFKSSWESDADRHWHACEFTGCTTRSDNDAHTWKATPSSSGGYDIKCSVCGRSKGSVTVTVSIPSLPLTYGQTATVTPECTTNPAQEFTSQTWELKENGKDDIIPMDTGGSLPANLPAGNYTLTFTGTRADNITLQGSTTFTVERAALTATVTAEDRAYNGTNTVNITNVELTGKVDGDDVSVNTANLTGTLSDPNAGDNKPVTLPELTLTGAAASNYTLTQPTVTPTVNILKASATPKTGNLEVVNNRAHTYTYGLGALWPDVSEGMSFGPNPVTYTLDSVRLGGYYTTGAEINDQTLTLPIQQVISETAGEIGTITVQIHTDNFEDMTASINVQSINKSIPTGQPILTPETLTYGEALSTIELSGSMKDDETGADVPGAFAWSTPTFRPDAQEAYQAAWTFTPADTSKYISVGGTSNIKVLSLSIEGAEIKLTTGVFPYDTEPHKPEITSVTLNGISLTADVDYTADIPEGRDPVTYTVTLTGKGNYTGTAETKFCVALSLDQKDSAGDSFVKVETKKDEFDITEDLKKHGITESDKIKHDLRVKIEWVNSDVTAKIEFYDVELQYKDENGNWHKVGPENFPEGGLTVFLPYPPNTGPAGFDFEIWHMITTGVDAGQVEPIACTPMADGLKCKFTSLSPVAIAYRAASLTPTPTPTPGGGGSGGGGGSSRPSIASSEAEETCPLGTDCPSLKFSDLGGVETWYHEAVDYVLLNALMRGYGNGVFDPNGSVTRAQFAQILYNRAGHPAVTGTSGFTDVLPGAWYAPAVTWAAGQNVVLGYGNGMFGPDDSITREQLAAMLWRYAGRPAATDNELHFSDAGKISRYAAEAMRWAVDNGIINGKGGGILDPQGLATRTQVAQMLMNFLEK